jgi:hypothetical protein
VMPKKEAPENTGPLSLAYSRSDEYLSRRDGGFKVQVQQFCKRELVAYEQKLCAS